MTKKKKTILISCISVAACLIITVGIILGIYLPRQRRNVNTPAINMQTYFNSSVTSDPAGNLALNYFIGKKPTTTANVLKKYTTLTFSGESAWISGMYLECVYFYFYCNTAKTDLIITVSVTGLDGGNADNSTLPTGTHKMQQKIGINSKANKGVLVRMDIGHTVLRPGNGSTLELSISLKDDTILANSDFKWTVYGVQVYGEHRK